MIHFDKEKYLETGKGVYALRGEIEKIADEISAKGYDNIFFMGVGGTTAELSPIKSIMESMSDVAIYLENAAELVLKGNRHLTERSIVVTASKSGDTKETTACAKWCKEQGIDVVAFVAFEDTPLAKYCRYVVVNPANGIENTYLKFSFFGLRLLYDRGDFPKYTEFADQMAVLHENMVHVKEKFDPRAKEIAERYYDEPIQYWLASDTLYGEAYLFSMCILEEMQWIRTKSITSAEFFHGTLEIVNKDTCVFLLKGEDACRPLDERAERFLKEHTDKLVVIDTKDFVLEGIDDEFRQIVAPMIITTILDGRLAYHFEQNTGHSLKFRRYYRQFEY